MEVTWPNLHNFKAQNWHKLKMWLAGKVLSLHLKFLDIDHPLTFEESKLRQIEAHALIYLSNFFQRSDFASRPTIWTPGEQALLDHTAQQISLFYVSNGNLVPRALFLSQGKAPWGRGCSDGSDLLDLTVHKRVLSSICIILIIYLTKMKRSIKAARLDFSRAILFQVLALTTSPLNKFRYGKWSPQLCSINLR